MNFNFDLDETIDEDFFGSLEGKSSKLQKLFMDDVLSPEEQQQTLKYQRPKASEFKTKDVPEEASSSKNSSSITLMAKVVQAFRQGESLGKVGLAVIQNPDKTCAIIMYKTKANILANLKLASNRLYKQVKYWQFYDDENLYWSFSFESLQDEEEFVGKLKLKNIAYKEAVESQGADEEEHNEVIDTSKSQILDYIEEKQLDSPKMVSFSKENKNSLIKRMAKMGKPLPTLPANNKAQLTTDCSDSSDTEVINTPLSLNQKPAIAPRGHKFSSNITTNQQQQLVASTVALNPTAVTSSAIYPINPLEGQYMQMLLSEQRTQGSELRMNMNKLENKIEKVLDKLELYNDRKYEGKEKPEKEDVILELEEKLLEMKKANRKLIQSLEEKSKENKFKDYLKDIQEDLKELNIKSHSDLKESISELIEQLRENNKENKFLKEKLKESERNNEDLRKDLLINEMKLKDVEQQLNNLKINEEMLQTNLNAREEELKQQKLEVDKLQNDLKEQQAETMNNAATESLVKSIMNNLYVDIADKLEQTNLTQQEQVLALVATSIRKQTLACLKQNNSKGN